VTHFNTDEIQALVDEAKKFGKPVAMHAHGIDGIRKAVEAGVTTLEHGTYLFRDPHLIQLMAERGVFLVPTLKVGWDIILAEKSNIPDWIMQKNKDSQGDAAKSLKMAYEAGVPIAMGSDVGTPLNVHGENALEVYWMEQAGLSKMDSIVAATGNAAKALGWDSWLGTLEAGKVADLIVHEKNPLEDLRALADKESLRFVMKDGMITAYNVLRKDDLLPKELMAGRVLRVG
jgi:imidazolonepropionase-like amidohydrolase